MKKKYKKEMDYVYAVINEMDRKLDRPIRDLDDVRMIMETLSKIREQEVDMEMRIDPIEVRSKSATESCSFIVPTTRRPSMFSPVMRCRWSGNNSIWWTICEQRFRIC